MRTEPARTGRVTPKRDRERLPLFAAAATTTTAAATAVIATTATTAAVAAVAAATTAVAAAATTAAAATAVATAATAAVTSAATTAAAAAEAAAATTTTAAAEAAAAAVLARLRLVHLQRTAVEVGAVHRLDGVLSILVGRHLDEGEAARTTGVPVEHDLDLRHLAAITTERCAQRVLGGLKGKVANVQSRTHRV